MNRPRIFISHSENNFGPTNYAINIIDLLGCIPVIAENQPKLTRPVPNLVSDTLNSCDGAVVIITPDSDDSSGKVPSQGVLIEIGKLQELDHFKEKYFVIKEESVGLSPMIPETRYKFSGTDYSPIAEAILIELGCMNFFRNYYELPGSDLKLHELMETLYDLRKLLDKGALKVEFFKHSVKKTIQKTIDQIIEGVD